MWLDKICCKCIDIRTGVKIMAILEIIAGLKSFGLDCLVSEHYDLIGTTIPICLGSVSAGSCILYGAIKNNITAIFAGLIILPIVFCVVVIALIIAMIVFGPALAMYLDVTIIGFGVYPYFTLLIMYYILFAIHNVYSWLVVLSFYRQLKADDFKFLKFLSGKF